ncbi:MAG: AAA family ATPase [Nitrososphaerales archaeon]
MAVITVSREYGSIGDDFGERVAHELGYHCVCKEFIGDLLAQYGLIEFEREYDSRPGFWNSLNKLGGERRSAVISMLNQVLQAVAQHGNVVIQGRSGFAALQGFSDVLHVRLQAPLAVRVERVAGQQRVTIEEAARIVKDGDAVRTGFVEGFYGVPWNSMHAFDLVLNTEKLASDVLVSWVVQAARGLEAQQEGVGRSVRQLQIDDVLAKAVATQLESAVGHC